jgi:hypothetical protein
MTCTDVTTQDQLDAALANADHTTCVHIRSEAGVWLRLSDTGSATVRAFDSATVEASGSATVEAFGSATVEAFGSATVRAFGSATVRAFDSATVRAFDSATVEASGSATVRAFGSAGIHAHYQSTVTATPHVAVWLHSGQATVTGGTLIDLTALDLDDPATWCGHHGVDVTDSTAVLHKALDSELTAGQGWGRPTVYTVGSTVTAEDWTDTNECGGGLHLSPTTSQATTYRDDAARWVRVEVALSDLRPIQGGTAKCKVRSCRVVAEVDHLGRDLPVALPTVSV